MLPLQLVFTRFGGAKISLMDKKHDTITFAVSLIIKAAVVAAKYSGRVLKRSLKRLGAMDIDDKDKEILLGLLLNHLRDFIGSKCFVKYLNVIERPGEEGGWI
jgi:hypothetical protein